jgi:hypothetical protein
MLGTWLAFGLLSVCVGGFLFAATWLTQSALASPNAATAAASVAALASC